MADLVLTDAALETLKSALSAALKDLEAVRHSLSKLDESALGAATAISAESGYADARSTDLWNLGTGTLIRQLRYNGPGTLGMVDCVAVSKDGRFALSGGTQLVLWDLRTYQNFRPIAGLPGTIHGVALSPDGKHALSGDELGTVILWSLATGREVRRFKGHGDIVWSVAFSRDGKYVATGAGGRIDAQKRLYVPGDDNMVRVWETATGKEVKVFKGHAGDVRSVAFSPDGKRLLSSGRDGTVFLWDVKGDKEVASFRGHTQYASGIVFLPDGRRALSASFDLTVCLWQLPD